MSGVTLANDHVAELTELLEFLNAWLTSDHDQLNASLHRYVGPPAYDIDRLKADLAGPKMSRLRREHHRLLGNGYCTRPPELDCAFEAICETCTFFQTSIEFRPTLQRQRDHAADHDQPHRADLFDRLLTRIDQQAS